MPQVKHKKIFLKFTGLPADISPIKSPDLTGSTLKDGAKKHLGLSEPGIRGIEMSIPLLKSD